MRPSQQMSISELNLVAIEHLFVSSNEEAAELFMLAALQLTVVPSEGQHDSTNQSLANSDSYGGSAIDSRAKVLRAILERRGQSGFRKKLIERYGARCVISGCDLLPVLEAAHIDPYRGEIHNHAENGLLMRADLHTLFDLGLLAIDPETWTVHLQHEASLVDGYAKFNGMKVSWGEFRPSPTALLRRWKLFLEQTQNSVEQTLSSSTPLAYLEKVAW